MEFTEMRKMSEEQIWGNRKVRDRSLAQVKLRCLFDIR